MFYEQGKLNEAIQTYQEAIAREPNFPEAYNNLGNALREAGRADEAIACYTMCIQLQLARPQNAQMARAMQVSWKWEIGWHAADQNSACMRLRVCKQSKSRPIM